MSKPEKHIPKKLVVPSLKDEVRVRLHEDIVTGRLQPGARIVETEIARMYGISQVPVREALRGLEEEGLVKSLKYKGAFVAEMKSEEVYHTFLLRAQIEQNVLKVVVPKLQDEDFNFLNGIISQIAEAVSEGDFVKHSELDMKFHGYLVDLSNVDVYTRTWRALYSHVRRFIALTHPTYFRDNHSAVIVQHLGLVDKLAHAPIAEIQESFFVHVMGLWL